MKYRSTFDEEYVNGDECGWFLMVADLTIKMVPEPKVEK